MLEWEQQPWHAALAKPLLAAQAAKWQRGLDGVVVPTARPAAAGLAAPPRRREPAPLPLAGEPLPPGALPPWRRAALAANVVTLAATLVAIAPLTLVGVLPAMAEAMGVAAAAAGL